MYQSTPFFMPVNSALNAGTSLFSKINFSKILSGTQKTLSFINQAIPAYYQIKPIVKNFKTISRIGKEFTKSTNNTNVNYNKNNVINNTNKVNGIINSSSVPNPNFFI